ncbi:hypothetical protein BH09ACT5_BH09ACT5_01270 [soil metagenome]
MTDSSPQENWNTASDLTTSLVTAMLFTKEDIPEVMESIEGWLHESEGDPDEHARRLAALIRSSAHFSSLIVAAFAKDKNVPADAILQAFAIERKMMNEGQ